MRHLPVFLCVVLVLSILSPCPAQTEPMEKLPTLGQPKPPLGPAASFPPESRLDCYLLSVAYEWDFAVGSHGFTTALCDHGGAAVWSWGPCGIAGAPPNVWGTVLDGSYPNDAGRGLRSPEFTVTADAHLVEVVHWFAIETNFDGGHVVVMPGGDLIEPIGGYTAPVISESSSYYAYCVDGQPGWTGSSGGWRIDCFDLGEFLGQTIALEFEFGSDASVVDEGWFLARVRIGRSGNPVAACCLPSGGCGLYTRDVCFEMGGLWNPSWTSCDPNPCSQPCPMSIVPLVWDFRISPQDFYGYGCEENAVPVWEYGTTSYVPGVAGAVWGTVLQGAYYNNSGGGLVSPGFLVTDSTKIVEIVHCFSFEYGYDGGNVSVMTDRDGTRSQEIISPLLGYTTSAISSSPSYYAYCVDGEPGWTGTSGGWRIDCFDLSPYLGQSVMLAFEMGSDLSVTSAGWYIADVHVGGSPSGYEAILQIGDWFCAESWNDWAGPTVEEPGLIPISLHLNMPDLQSPITSVDFYFEQGGGWTYISTDTDGTDPRFDSVGESLPTGDGWSLAVALSEPFPQPAAHFRAVAHTASREEHAVECLIPIDPTPPSRASASVDDWSIIDEDTLGVTITPNGVDIDSVVVWARMMPDVFNKTVPGINQLTHSPTHCAPTAAAQCLKYFELVHGDTDVTGGLSDDALVDALAAYMKTNMAPEPGTYLRNWIGGLSRWLEDHGAGYSLRSFRHYDESGRLWTEQDWRRIRNEFERCHDVMLGIFWDATPSCRGGHTLTLCGLSNDALENGNYWATFMDPWMGVMTSGQIDPDDGRIEEINGTGACIGATLIVTPTESRPGGLPLAQAVYAGPNLWPDPIPVPLPEIGRYFTDVVVTNMAGHAYRRTTPIIRRDGSAAPEETRAPSRFALGMPRPNPFGTGTRVEFALAEAAPVSITIFDVTGAKTRTLFEGTAGAGTREVLWDGRDDAGRPAPGGIYYIRLTASGIERTRSVMLLR
ncbi:MAG: hypothetical protein KBD56_09735 [Candidatus Eisenbacteria bacterium]|nr:hypothetical protein [Candidatus Eisenbacteria bacterium]